MTAPPLTCVSWNIHRGRCNDGRMDPAAMLRVLREEVWQPNAQVLMLQEADAEAAPHDGVLDVAEVEAITGLCHVQTERLHRSTDQSHGFNGVIIYLHPRIQVEDVRLLDLPGACPRGAVVVDAVHNGQGLRIVGTHLSLSQALRIAQMRRIGRLIAGLDQRPLIVAGDLNEWRPWGGLALRPSVTKLRLSGPRRASFPTRRPVLPLDRVLTSAPGRVEGLRVLDGPGIRETSDHRPVVAQIYPAA